MKKIFNIILFFVQLISIFYFMQIATSDIVISVSRILYALVFGGSFIFGLYQLTVQKYKFAWIIFIIPLLLLCGILLFYIIDPFKGWDKLFY
jgi:uncharacterized membrane protein